MDNIRKLFSMNFLKDFSVLLSGTVLSQIILIIFLPILTRLYTPSQYGTFGIFFSIVSIISIGANGKYELAIMLQENDYESFLVSILCFIFSVVYSFFVLFILLFISSYYFKNFFYYSFLIILSVIFLGLKKNLSFYFNKKALFTLISVSKILQSLLIVVFSIIFYSIESLRKNGLILGYFLGVFISTLYLLFYFLYKNKIFLFNFFPNISRELSLILKLAKKNINYPKFTLLSGFLNTLSARMPVLILPLFFSSDLVGNFFLAQRILTLPVTLIGQSIGQIYFQRVSLNKESAGIIKKMSLKLFRGLFFIGILPFTVIAILGSKIFPIFLGPKWFYSGLFSQYLSGWLFMVLIFSPLTFLIFVYNKQKEGLIYDSISVLFRGSVLFILPLLIGEINITIISYAFMSFLLLIFWGRYILSLVKVRFTELRIYYILHIIIMLIGIGNYFFRR